MPVVQFKQTAQPCQVEGLPLVVDTDKKDGAGDVVIREFERSAEGALHFRPGGTMVLTADEFSWLKSNRPKVFNDLLILAEDPAPAPVKTVEAPKTTAKTSPKSDDSKPADPSNS